jgi:hypothetical protein
VASLLGLARTIRDRFLRTTAPSLAEARAGLWSADPAGFAALPPGYVSAVMDQYKLYVEMADRVSARRMTANTFFLTLNSAAFTVVGVIWHDRLSASPWWLVFPLILVLGECAAWYWLLRSYRQLNAAKYAVIGAIEEKLPISPYWAAEWSALGQGADPTRYLPLTHLEQWVPALFAATYVAAFVAALVA